VCVKRERERERRGVDRDTHTKIVRESLCVWERALEPDCEELSMMRGTRTHDPRQGWRDVVLVSIMGAWERKRGDRCQIL